MDFRNQCVDVVVQMSQLNFLWVQSNRRLKTHFTGGFNTLGTTYIMELVIFMHSVQVQMNQL